MDRSIAITASVLQDNSCDVRNGADLRKPQNAAMDIEQIKQGLKKSGKSQAGLARALRLDPSQVTRLLKGGRRLKADEIQKIHDYLSLEAPIPAPPAAHSEQGGFPRDVPIREGAQCGENDVFDFESQTADFAPRPPRLAGVHDAYALYVRGDSMEPWREHGQLVYVHPGVPARINDFVVVQLKPKAGGMPPAYLKRLVNRTSREIRLLQYNPRKYLTFPLTQILAIHRVMDPVELLGA